MYALHVFKWPLILAYESPQPGHCCSSGCGVPWYVACGPRADSSHTVAPASAVLAWRKWAART